MKENKKKRYPVVRPRDPKLAIPYLKGQTLKNPTKWEVTFFGHTQKKYGVRANLNFLELVKHIACPQRIADHWNGTDEMRKWEKDSQKCFMPGTYEDDRRLKTKVQQITMLVWDIDDNEQNYDGVKQFLDRLDLTYIMHTSYSHVDKKKEKFRVILPLSRPIPVAYFDAYHVEALIGFKQAFRGEPDLQALTNRAITYNVCYKTPYMRCDWNEGNGIADLFDVVQKRFAQMQKKKGFELLEKQFKSTAKRTAHPMHTDDRTDRIARLYNCKTTLRAFLSFIGARQNENGQWVGWTCPRCHRSDATVLSDGGRAFCNHKNSCKHGSWLYPELAREMNWL